MNRFLSRRFVAPSAGVLALLSSPTWAVVDYTPITSAIDVAGVQTAILAVGAIMMGIVVVRWGVRKIVGFFR